MKWFPTRSLFSRLLDGIGNRAFIDIDSLLRPVYGHAEEGASFGHTKIAGRTVLRRGLSPLAVTVCTQTAAPVLAGVRLRAGRAGSSRGAAGMLTEAINTAVAAGAQPQNLLVRGDTAYCSGKVFAAVVKAGARFLVRDRPQRRCHAAIATIGDQAYQPVHYPGAVVDPDTGPSGQSRPGPAPKINADQTDQLENRSTDSGLDSGASLRARR
jgi:hypothetical protein